MVPFVEHFGVYFFPLFHVVPLNLAPHKSQLVVPALSFDPAAFAENFWSQKLRPAAAQAGDSATVLTALKLDPAKSKLIGGFIETYLQLSAEEMIQYEREFARLTPG